MLDSFFDLKMGGIEGNLLSPSVSASSSSSSVKLKDGIFTISVDTQEFDPEDLDIVVEGMYSFFSRQILFESAKYKVSQKNGIHFTP